MTDRPSHHTGQPGSSRDNPIEYKGYIIYLSLVQHEACAYCYEHKDWDGPEDNRAGYERTIEACKDAIDDLEEGRDDRAPF